jgi:hypothetical protein
MSNPSRRSSAERRKTKRCACHERRVVNSGVQLACRVVLGRFAGIAFARTVSTALRSNLRRSLALSGCQRRHTETARLTSFRRW